MRHWTSFRLSAVAFEDPLEQNSSQDPLLEMLSTPTAQPSTLDGKGDSDAPPSAVVGAVVTPPSLHGPSSSSTTTDSGDTLPPSSSSSSSPGSAGLYASVGIDVFSTSVKTALRRNSFHHARFLFELVTQVLFPLSGPIVLLAQNYNAAVNKGFLPGTDAFKIDMFHLTYMTVPLAFAAAVRDEHYWGMYAVSVSYSFALFRKLVIAGKYGCYTNERYQRLMYRDYDVKKDLLLLSWYTEIEQTLLDDLIMEAEADAHVSLEGQYFILADGVTRLCAKVYLQTLVRRSFKPARPALNRAVTAATLGLTFLPMWLYLVSEASMVSWKAIVLLVLTLLQTYFYGAAYFGFLAAGFLHYWRFMRLHYFHAKSLGFAGVYDRKADQQTIPASIARNLIVWTSVRAVMKNFSHVHTSRVSFNFFANLLLCSLFMLILLQQFLSPEKQYPLVAILAYVFFVTFIGMLSATFMALRTNRASTLTLKLFQDEQFAFLWRKVHTPATHPNPAGSYGLVKWQGSTKALEALSDEQEFTLAFDVVKETLSRGNESEPVVVMFVPASPELVGFVLSLFVSGMTLVVGVIATSGLRVGSSAA